MFYLAAYNKIISGQITVTICEIKYTEDPFLIDKQYKSNLENKIAVYQKHTKTQKQIFLAMITSAGIKPNIHSDGFVANQLTLKDLLQE